MRAIARGAQVIPCNIDTLGDDRITEVDLATVCFVMFLQHNPFHTQSPFRSVGQSARKSFSNSTLQARARSALG